MGLVNADLNNASLDDDNFDNNDPETILYDRLMIWCNRFGVNSAHFLDP